jgi:uncharacterized protein YdeI (YjbR/CyaY-like superfamily)
MPMGAGRACLGVHKATRQAAGVEFGQQVTVEIAVDLDQREVVMPPDLDEALSASSAVRAAFEQLAPSRRRELVTGVVEARKRETRDRRIGKIIDVLRGS